MNIIIWGLKPYTHTHSWIHSGFYRGFKFLGFPVFWLDKNDNFDLSLFNNAIVISESNNDEEIPLNRSATYFVHRYKPNTYIGCRVINVEFYTKPLSQDSDLKKYSNYKDLAQILNTYSKIENTTFFSNEINPANNMFAPTIFMSWGTDLLPDEIEIIHPDFIKHSRRPEVFFIGTVWGLNHGIMDSFAKELVAKNIPLNIAGVHHGIPVNNELAKHMTRLSLFSPAIVGEEHVEMGYVPCRLIKNISYSRMPSTNSPHLKELFPEIIYSSDLSELIDVSLDFENNPSIDRISSLMENVQQNHTYVNRAKSMMELL